MEILLDLSAMIDPREDMYRNKPDRIAELRRERNGLARAILNRDEDFAVAIDRRCLRMSYQWHQEDEAKRSADGKADSEARRIPMPQHSDL